MATASSLLSISSTSYLKVRCSVLWWSDLHSLAETVACSGCPLRSQLGIWILDIDIGAFWSSGRYQILCGSRPEPIPSRVRFLRYYDAIMDSSCLGAMHLKSRMVRVVLGEKTLEVFPNTALKAVPYPAQLRTAACSLPIVPFFPYKISCTWICRTGGKLRRGQRWEGGKQGFSCPVLSRACHWNKWEISHSTVHRQLSLWFSRGKKWPWTCCIMPETSWNRASDRQNPTEWSVHLLPTFAIPFIPAAFPVSLPFFH